MATVTLQIGGREYQLGCRDGGEAQLIAMGALVDDKIAEVTRSVGDLTESRALLMGALLLADELAELRNRADEATVQSALPLDTDPALALAIERLAQRMESLATSLEEPRRTA